jgi:hypothetical protein
LKGVLAQSHCILPVSSYTVLPHRTLLAGKRNHLEIILNTFESGRTLAKAFDNSVSSLVITRTALLETEKATEDQDSNVMQYSWVLSTLSEAGFSGQEVWDGAVNLVEVVKSFQLDREGTYIYT